MVLSVLREANVAIQDMQLQEADLEDVFLNLVGNQKGASA
jgi:ABC-2 type transport system ATP-binding protein